ncbi:hypothetical protein ACLB1E_25465 [Escherichia coli]
MYAVLSLFLRSGYASGDQSACTPT